MKNGIFLFRKTKNKWMKENLNELSIKIPSEQDARRRTGKRRKKNE